MISFRVRSTSPSITSNSSLTWLSGQPIVELLGLSKYQAFPTETISATLKVEVVEVPARSPGEFGDAIAQVRRRRGQHERDLRRTRAHRGRGGHRQGLPPEGARLAACRRSEAFAPQSDRGAGQSA